MTTRIGFVILSHANPWQTIRLIRRLQRMYDNPPIVCHHDFGQSPISHQDFPPGIRLVLPHVATRWGHFSLVTAFLRSLAMLHEDDNGPDWFVLLSGTDYPTREADRVIDELTSSGTDAFLDFREVSSDPHAATLLGPRNPALDNFSSPSSLSEAKRRYVDFNGWKPVIRPGPRLGKQKVFLPFKSFLSPFASNFKCFYGDHWFAGNRKVATTLLHPTGRHVWLRLYLLRRWCPEECYYASVLANLPDLKITRATRRFTSWRTGSAHPRILDMNDLPAIVSSNAHFARKFAPEAPVLDEIDRMLG